MQIVSTNLSDYILKEIKEASHTWNKDRFELVAVEVKNFLERPFEYEDFSEETFREIRLVDQRITTTIRKCKLTNTKESLECLPYLTKMKGSLELFSSFWTVRKKDFKAEVTIKLLNNPEVIKLLRHLERVKSLSLSEVFEWGQANGIGPEIEQVINTLWNGDLVDGYWGSGGRRYSIARAGIRYLNHIDAISKEMEDKNRDK